MTNQNPPTMKWMPLLAFAGIIVLGIVDLGMCIFAGPGASLSAFIAGNSASKIPSLSVFIFATGCVCGHLFFPMQQIISNDKTT